jgi:GTPase SAR1 family protein
MQQVYNDLTMQYTYLFKCVLVGASGVGKTCLLNQFINASFNHLQPSTEGEQFASKTIEFKNKVVELQVWDIVTVILCREGTKTIADSLYHIS